MSDAVQDTFRSLLNERGGIERFDETQTPIWQPPEYWKEQEEMKKSDHPFEHIEHLTDMVERGEVGKNVAHLRAKSWHDKNAFDIDRKDARGKVMSDAQQFERFSTIILSAKPSGRRARSTG
jgi:hypothetical protein